MKKLSILFIIATMFLFCDKKSTEPDPVKPGSLKVSFELVQVSYPRPSYQTVIWLTDKDDQFIQSFFVSEWLAFNGYSRGDVCSKWVNVANWGDVSQDVFDAATGATPSTSENSMTIDCHKAGLEPGKIHCYIETHIVEDYNVYYKAEITLGSKAVSVTPEPTYVPEKHAETGDVLVNVLYEYTPSP